MHRAILGRVIYLVLGVALGAALTWWVRARPAFGSFIETAPAWLTALAATTGVVVAFRGLSTWRMALRSEYSSRCADSMLNAANAVVIEFARARDYLRQRDSTVAMPTGWETGYFDTQFLSAIRTTCIHFHADAGRMRLLHPTSRHVDHLTKFYDTAMATNAQNAVDMTHWEALLHEYNGVVEIWKEIVMYR